MSYRTPTAADEKVLAKAVTAEGRVIVGTVGRENDAHVELFELGTGQPQIFKRTELRSLKKAITDADAATSLGWPTIIAWRVQQFVPPELPAGKVLKLADGVVYVSLGANTRVEQGNELRVYRGNTELKDPDTGEVLGIERRLVARLNVTEVRESFSKAKLEGDLEISLDVGDIVELANSGSAIAVLPIVEVDGTETLRGQEIAEQLTFNLTRKKVPVVERKLLASVIAELAIQNTYLFDPAKAQQIGKQLGAFAALAGTTITKEKYTDVQIRLIEVATGKILYATSFRVFGRASVDKANQGRTSLPPGAPRPIDDSSPPISGVAVENSASSTAVPMGHWTLDGDVTSSTPTELRGRLVGDASFAQGQIGKCISLDGTEAYALVYHDDALSVEAGDFSLAAWVRPMSYGDPGHPKPILCKAGYNWKKGWCLDLVDSGAVRFSTSHGVGGGAGTLSCPPGTLSTGEWQHIAVVVRRSNTEPTSGVYVNGRLVKTGVLRPVDLDNSAFDLYFGRCEEFVFHGQIDDVRLFRGALSDLEIRKFLREP